MFSSFGLLQCWMHFKEDHLSFLLEHGLKRSFSGLPQNVDEHFQQFFIRNCGSIAI